MDYPFNRIVLDIVELLQDLKAQGMLFVLNLNGVGSLDVRVFENDTEYHKWLAGGYEAKQWYVMPNDTAAAHMCWNDLIAYKVKSEVEL